MKVIGLNPGYLLKSFLLYITMYPHGFSGPPTALHTEGGAFAGCKTNLKPRNIFLHSFKRIWQAESKNSKWLGVISTNYTKKSRVWLRIYSSVYNTKTRMPCRPGGKYWDSWDVCLFQGWDGYWGLSGFPLCLTDVSVIAENSPESLVPFVQLQWLWNSDNG